MPQIFNSSALLRLKEMMKLAGLTKPQGSFAVLKTCFDFMANFEDAYPKEIEYNAAVPDFSEMTLEEARGYFTFRTAVRGGRVPAPKAGFVRLYAYELINGLGVPDPPDAFDKLARLAKMYEDEPFAPQLARWLLDFALVNESEMREPFIDLVQKAGLSSLYRGLEDSKSRLRKAALALRQNGQDSQDSDPGQDCFEETIDSLLEGLRSLLACYGLLLDDLLYCQDSLVWSDYAPFTDAVVNAAPPLFRQVTISGSECYQQISGNWRVGQCSKPIAGANELLALLTRRAQGAIDSVSPADKQRLFAGSPLLAVVADEAFDELVAKGELKREDLPAEALDLYERVKRVRHDKANPASQALCLNKQSQMYASAGFAQSKRASYAALTGLVSEMTLPQFITYLNFRKKPFSPGPGSRDYIWALANETLVSGDEHMAVLERLSELLPLAHRFPDTQRMIADWMKDYAMFAMPELDYPAWAVSHRLEAFYPTMFLLSNIPCDLLSVCLALSDYPLSQTLMEQYSTSYSEALSVAFDRLSDAFMGRDKLKAVLLGERETTRYEPFKGAVSFLGPQQRSPGDGESRTKRIVCGDEIYEHEGNYWRKTASTAESSPALGHILRIADSFLCRSVGMRETSDNVKAILEFPYESVFKTGPQRDQLLDITCAALRTFVDSGNFKQQAESSEATI